MAVLATTKAVRGRARSRKINERMYDNKKRGHARPLDSSSGTLQAIQKKYGKSGRQLAEEVLGIGGRRRSATGVQASTPGSSRERHPMLEEKSPRTHEVWDLFMEFDLETDYRYGAWD